MELILLQDIRNLGKIGDLVKVKGGYARNYLLPNHKAVRSTEQNKVYFEKRKAEISKESDQKLKAAIQVLEGVKGQTLTILRQAAEDGKLYGSVSARDIAISLKEINDKFEREHVVLEEPIKYLGEYKINISLHPEAEEEVTVLVVRNETAE